MMPSFFKIMKRLRVAVALVVFCSITAQFLDIYHKLPKPYFMWNPTGTQFVPSLLETLATGSIAAGAAFITFSIFSLIFGRAYCSFFCPLGIFMDGIRRVFGNRKMKFAKAHNAIRAVFLCLAVACILFGYMSLLGFLDPYSLFGKIAGIFRLGTAESANFLSDVLASAGNYSAITPVSGSPEIALPAFGASIAILIAVSIFSALRGRIWCNTICPVGAFLGFFSRFSLFKISLDKSKCVSCGMCEKSCKTQCISSKNKELDFSRCVLCFNCASACKKNAITISMFGSSSEKVAVSRRKFPKLSLALFGILMASAQKELKASEEKNMYKNPKNARSDSRLCVPAGAKSVENFLDKCTGCQACVAACKASILKPSVSEWGLSHFMQPFMDYSSGFCLDTCHSCTKVCPTGAIQFMTLKQKTSTKIGTAMFKRSLCVVKTNGTDCSACGEHCPVQAIEMVPFKGRSGLYIPYVHKDVCIGCGACENVCPVTPKKAIVVRGLAVHKEAKPFDESMRRHKRKNSPGKRQRSGNPFPF